MIVRLKLNSIISFFLTAINSKNVKIIEIIVPNTDDNNIASKNSLVIIITNIQINNWGKFSNNTFNTWYT